MLHSLHINNFALIEALDIEFSSGLNIVTGETGAGKSVIIGGIQLLLGQRADKSMIRTGATQATIAAIYELEEEGGLSQAVASLLAESGVPASEDGQLILKRVISEKSTRNFINSSPVNLQILRAIGEVLVDVHGPYDHQSLLRPAKQLEVVDNFAGLGHRRRQCSDAHRAWRDAQEQLMTWERDVPSGVQLDNLRAQLSEIRDANLDPGAAASLGARHAVAANSRELLELLDSCRMRLVEGDGNVTDQLGDCVRNLQSIEQLDPNRGPELVAQLEELSTLMSDFVSELTDYAMEIDVDPRELAELEAQIAVLHGLKRKYGQNIDKILEYADGLERDLDRAENSAHYRQELQDKLAAAEAEWKKHAHALARARRREVPKLAAAITDKLQGLGFPECRFEIGVDEGPPTAFGNDVIEFAFSPNPGEGQHPLRAIASSGEIARVMLAIKAVLAAADDVPVLIFDEVDANIGGTTAVSVGLELRRLAEAHQTICITHLPQVAAGASRHFQVTKEVKKRRTQTRLTVLSENERVSEIARMLGGKESSSVVLQHAEELIRCAAG